MDRKQTNSVGRDLSRCLSDQDLQSKYSIERENESRADPFRKLSNNSLDTHRLQVQLSAKGLTELARRSPCLHTINVYYIFVLGDRRVVPTTPFFLNICSDTPAA